MRCVSTAYASTTCWIVSQASVRPGVHSFLPVVIMPSCVRRLRRKCHAICRKKCAKLADGEREVRQRAVGAHHAHAGIAARTFRIRAAAASIRCFHAACFMQKLPRNRSQCRELLAPFPKLSYNEYRNKAPPGGALIEKLYGEDRLYKFAAQEAVISFSFLR